MNTENQYKTICRNVVGADATRRSAGRMQSRRIFALQPAR